MPYIHHHGKDDIEPLLIELLKYLKKENNMSPFYGSSISGTLNYVITRIILVTGPQSYSDYNALVGVLECCKLEFYRRAVVAYEDEKIKENGDVYI